MKARSSLTRRGFLAAGGAAIAAPAIATGAAGEPRKWRMVTSWPKNLPGPGVTAQRLADRMTRMSAGALSVELHAAGEIVSALEVFDAVAGNVAQLGHTASFFWQGKMPASAFFTAVPFGLTAAEHTAWVYHGGGQALWDELYAPFGIIPFMAGNTGMGMGGWFKKELHGLDDIKGLKYRIPGLGGEVLRRLGGVPVSLAPGEILTALQSGTIDGAEFVGPWSDLAFGFYQAAPNYYWPGFHEPNGSAECLVHRASFDELPAHLQEIVRNACVAENSYSLAETRWHNGEALQTLVRDHGVAVRPFPAEVLAAAREVSAQVLDDLARRDQRAGAIYASYGAARERAMEWSRLSTQAFLNARLEP